MALGPKYVYCSVNPCIQVSCSSSLLFFLSSLHFCYVFVPFSSFYPPPTNNIFFFGGGGVFFEVECLSAKKKQKTKTLDHTVIHTLLVPYIGTGICYLNWSNWNVTLHVPHMWCLFKGSVQQILRGVNTKLKLFVLVNWLPTPFSFWISKIHHHKRSIKPFSVA